MENSVDRESYSLAAGLALGLVVFGRGNSLSGWPLISSSKLPNRESKCVDLLLHFSTNTIDTCGKTHFLWSKKKKYITGETISLLGPLLSQLITARLNKLLCSLLWDLGLFLGLADMTIPDTLHHFMVGGPKRPYLGSQRDKYKTPSFLIFEGPLVNTHVTGPGATLALGMLYFNTGNKWVYENSICFTLGMHETAVPFELIPRIDKFLSEWSLSWSDPYRIHSQTELALLFKRTYKL